MRVLLTGVSSFTGCWFGAALAQAGIEVVGTCRQQLDEYDALATSRLVHARSAGCTLVAGVSFGDEAFLQLMRKEPFDLLCHHGIEVGDFRRDDFDPAKVLAGATCNAGRVVRTLAETGARGLVVTGSVFEAGEGNEATCAPALFSYGLAKRLVWESLHFHASTCGLTCARFVVPHPFGPFDKPGLVDQAMRLWLVDQPFPVQQPKLIRDFIHVDFLAAGYAAFCAEQLRPAARRYLAPSGLIATLLAQLQHLAVEMVPRLAVRCAVKWPLAAALGREESPRFNTDTLPGLAAGWPYARSWDRLAEFYLRLKLTR